MSREQFEALRNASADNEELRTNLAATQSTEDFVRVANENGFEILIEDVSQDSDQQLSDAELVGVSGGYTFPRTDWVYCDNPWTNYWCTIKC